MAADFILVERSNSAAVFASDPINLSRQIRTLLDLAQSISDKGARMVNGTDYTLFETLYGFPTGTGQPYLNFVNGTISALQGTAQNSNAIEIMNRVG